VSLACIAHKSLEIFERCKLWQQNSPAMPNNSAAFFGENSLKQALKMGVERLFKSFFSRNGRVNSHGA
jgi:hypothetical protein